METIKNPAIFLKRKETKGTIVYEEIGDLPIFGTVYIKEYAVKELGLSDTISVEVRKG